MLREFFPSCGLTADLITGFPGEDEQEFSETLAFIEKCAFSSMHIFPYSIRPGTVAASMPEQCEKSVKNERAARAAQLAEQMKRRYLAACIGQSFSVLFESKAKTGSVGHAENYCEVMVPEGGLAGCVREVEITGVENDRLIGQLL